MALCELQLLIRDRHKAVPVVKPGERVGQGETLQRGHVTMALAGVADDSHQQGSIDLWLHEIILCALAKGFDGQFLVVPLVEHNDRGRTCRVTDVADGLNARAVRQ
jgi:hypothetical protein